MGQIQRHMDAHTKDELREKVRGHGGSIPRGANKHDVARILVELQNMETVHNYKGLTSLQSGDIVWWDDKKHHVQYPKPGESSVVAYRNGSKYVFNAALRDSIGVFRGDEHVDSVEKLRVSRMHLA